MSPNLGLPPIRSVYQPIVDLLHGGTVGYESLVRGAAGAELSTPAELFGWATSAGRLADLDWACRMSALRTAVEAALPRGSSLFLNVEPAAFSTPVPPELEALAERAAAAGLRVVAEVTERSLAADPAALLRFADAIRKRGWALAVDDVGADIASLAMMPFLAPEVIKLDLRLIQDRTTVDVAHIVNAVNAHAREGALVLAEGIETEDHEELARSMGAHLGQGWLYGRPAPLPEEHVATPLRLVPPRRRWSDLPQATVPWDLVKDGGGVRRSRKPLLAAMSRHLERQALTGDPATVVIGAFQRAEYFTPATARRFTALASAASMVAVFGAGMPEVPATGVRGHSLDEGDDLLHEWTIAVIGPHFAGALVARDVGDDAAEAERRFDYVVTYDRQTVVDAAAVMMRRLGARRPGVEGVVELPPQPSRLELLSRAVSAAANGIVIADLRAPDLPLIYANAGFERLTGYAVEEILGRNCRFLQGPDTDPAAVRALGDLVRWRETGAVTLLNYRKDGRAWWNEVTLSPMHDAAGVVTHMIGVQQDVTARVEAEAEVVRLGSTDPLTGLANRCTGLRDIERLLTGDRPVALVFCDLDGFKHVNDRHGHVVGDRLLAAIGRGLGECLSAGEGCSGSVGTSSWWWSRELTPSS